MEGIAVENDRISNFERLVTLTLEQVILHTIVHHASTSTYTPNFIKFKEFFVDGQMDVPMHERTDIRDPLY